MKNSRHLNHELIRLLELHNIRPAELARRLGIFSSTIYDIKDDRRALGEQLFVKILRKGFRLPEKEVRRIFTKAVNEKYLDDPELKS